MSSAEYVKECLYQDSGTIFEPAKDGTTPVRVLSNNTKGVLHELLVGLHLNGGEHMGLCQNEYIEPTETYTRSFEK